MNICLSAIQRKTRPLLHIECLAFPCTRSLSFAFIDVSSKNVVNLYFLCVAIYFFVIVIQELEIDTMHTKFWRMSTLVWSLWNFIFSNADTSLIEFGGTIYYYIILCFNDQWFAMDLVYQLCGLNSPYNGSSAFFHIRLKISDVIHWVKLWWFLLEDNSVKIRKSFYQTKIELGKYCFI